MYIFIIIFSVEFISRSLLYFITKNSKIYLYGVNKDIKITAHSFSNFEFYISDQDIINKKDISSSNLYLDSNKLLGWVFGGSQSKGEACGKNSSSWPILLENMTSYKLVNYSRHNVNSDFSTNLLISQLEKKNIKIPNSIFWSHKLNEQQVISFGLKRNKDKIKYDFLNKNFNKVNYYLKSITESIKSKFVFYYIIDETILRIKQKIGINIKEHNNRKRDKKDYEIAIENYKLNTIDAIKVASTHGVKNFYLVSLFDNYNLNSIFFSLFEKTVKSLSLEFDVYFIDTNKHLNEYSKENLFCDIMHKTRKGNRVTAQIIHKFIKINNND